MSIQCHYRGNEHDRYICDACTHNLSREIILHIDVAKAHLHSVSGVDNLNEMK